MKKVLTITTSILMLLALVSCASLSSEPTLVGHWTNKNVDETIEYYFTSDNLAVKEVHYEDADFYEYGYYYEENGTIYGDLGAMDYVLEGKNLFLDGEAFTRVSKKAIQSKNIQGVWQNDFYTLGLATDGLIISQGAYLNNGEWSAMENELTADGYSSDFVIVNNNLYIDDFDFIDEYDVVKFERVSSSGRNNTSLSILCSQPWYYKNSSSMTDNGTLYQFYTNGRFDAVKIDNGIAGNQFNGTYKLNGCKIELGDGGVLYFAYIDNTVIGYSFY